MTLTVRVRNGHLVLDAATQFPEGAEVTLQVSDGDDLNEQERAMASAIHASRSR